MDIEDCITQLEEVFEGEPWYGTSVLKSLELIPVLFWNKNLENSSSSIAKLVYHIIDWRWFIIEKVKNNETFSIELNSEKDWRKNSSVITQEEKEKCIGELIKTQELLCRLVSEKPDSWLYEFAAGKDYSNEYMIRGLLQHDLYHLGQINMLYSKLKK